MGMNVTDWVLAGAAFVGSALSLGGAAISHGRSAGRNDVLSKDVEDLEARLTDAEKIKADVQGLKQDFLHLGDRMADAQKLYATELARLADQTTAGHKLMETHLGAFKELTSSQMGEMNEGIRSIRAQLENRPSERRPARRTAAS